MKELTQYEKELIQCYKRFIQGNQWDEFFSEIAEDSRSFTTCRNIFQFCLHNIPNLMSKIHNIPTSAFCDMRIDSITIPGNIDEIQYGAFNGSNVHKLEIMSGVRSIDSQVFYYANIGELIIPDTIENIGTYGPAFNSRTTISKIIVPLKLEDFITRAVDSQGANVGEIETY